MTVNVRYLSDHTAEVVRAAEGGKVVPLARAGTVIGVLVRTDASDLYGTRQWGTGPLVSMRDFTRQNMSQFTERVAQGEAVAVSRRNVPVLIIVPTQDALAEGLLVGESHVAAATGQVGRPLTADELASGL